MDDFHALHRDAPRILEDLSVLGGKKIRGIFLELSKRTDSQELYKTFIRVLGKGGENLSIRRISCFGDTEGKTRIIGILDYWSQTVLRPIHDGLAAILKRIPEDCTFDQSSFIAKLPKEGPFYSFDLHAATDRLPVEMQEDILSSIIGGERARA
jgi:hypothetical protein